MKCTLVGTSAAIGIPAPICDCNYCKHKIRTRPSLLVEYNDTNLLFDVSPDVNKQLHGKCTDIDYIFLTHHHHDHSTGLRELKHTTLDKNIIKSQNSNEKLLNWFGNTYDLYCSEETETLLNESMDYIMKDKSFNISTINDNNTITINNLNITPFIAEHSIDYMGYIIHNENKSVVYHPDYGKLNTQVNFENIDYLVTDGSSLLGYDIHGTKKEFQNMIDTINPDNVLFTNVSEHISQKNTKELKSSNKKWKNSIVEDGYIF